MSDCRGLGFEVLGCVCFFFMVERWDVAFVCFSRLKVGMFPLVLTVLSRDYGSNY